MSQRGVGTWMTLPERLNARKPCDLQIDGPKVEYFNIEIPTGFARESREKGRGFHVGLGQRIRGQERLPSQAPNGADSHAISGRQIFPGMSKGEP